MAAHEPFTEGETSLSFPEPESFANGSSPKPEPETNVEPIPEWTEAIKSWGSAWDFHLYGLGTVFLTLAILSLGCLLRLLVKNNKSNPRKVSVILLGFLAIYGTSRGVFLFVDAYHHKNILPTPVLNVIWGIAQPCLITSYTLLFVVLLNAVRLKQRFQAWFTARNIALVTVPHFLFVFGAELTVSFSPQLNTLIFFCQLLYALLNFFLALLYIIVTFLTWKSVNNMKNNTDSGVSSKKRIYRILCACVVAATGGVLIGGTQVYIMAGPFGVFSNKGHYAPAWPWYWLTTITRMLEIYMAVVLFSIAQHQSSKGSSVRRVKVASIGQKTESQTF